MPDPLASLCIFVCVFVYLCVCMFVFLCICVTHAIVANGCLIPSHLLFYLRILQLPSDGETLSDGIEGGGGGTMANRGVMATIHVQHTQFSLTLSDPRATRTCANGPKFASFLWERASTSLRWWYRAWWTTLHWKHFRHHDILKALSLHQVNVCFYRFYRLLDWLCG